MKRITCVFIILSHLNWKQKKTQKINSPDTCNLWCSTNLGKWSILGGRRAPRKSPLSYTNSSNGSRLFVWIDDYFVCKDPWTLVFPNMQRIPNKNKIKFIIFINYVKKWIKLISKKMRVMCISINCAIFDGEIRISDCSWISLINESILALEFPVAVFFRWMMNGLYLMSNGQTKNKKHACNCLYHLLL